MHGNIVAAHSEIGASSYSRWRACPGSVALSRGVEKTESVYAAEGTAAHEEAAHLLTVGGVSQDEHIQTYVDYIRKLDQKSLELMIEKRFDLSHYYPGLFGTADAVAYYPIKKHLIVADFKFGQGVPVEVEENVQLMYYGLGAMHSLGRPVNSVELVIVQPRCYHPNGPIRAWHTTPLRMLDFVADLIEDAKKTTWPNAPLVPGDHCRWCPAQAAKCPAIKTKALAMAQQVFDQVTPYDPQKLSDTLAMLPAMESWIKSVREFAYREADLGRVPPGYKLVPKRANRKWREGLKPEDLAQEVGLKPPEVVDWSIKSPAQIEKLLPKEHKSLIEKLVTKESSGATLVPVADARPELTSPNAAREIFEVV